MGSKSSQLQFLLLVSKILTPFFLVKRRYFVLFLQTALTFITGAITLSLITCMIRYLIDDAALVTLSTCDRMTYGRQRLHMSTMTDGAIVRLTLP